MASTASRGNSTARNNSAKRGRPSGSAKKEKERSRNSSDEEESPPRINRNRDSSSSTEREGNEREGYERGSWECTVCTYRNPSEAFRCEMCEVRKGTSTRKPKLNPTMVEQQQIVEKFVQQQAVIMAQAGQPGQPGREKRPTNEKSSSASSANGGACTNASGTNFGCSPPETPSSTLSAGSSTGGPVGTIGINHSGCCSPSLSVSPSCSKTPPPSLAVGRLGGQFTPSPLPFAPPSNHQNNVTPQTAPACSSSPSPSSSPALSSHSKLLPAGAGVRANSSPRSSSKNCALKRGTSASLMKRIRGSPSTFTTSRLTGIPCSAPISNVDQNSARTLAVTVNGITVVITDYKLRPGQTKCGKDSTDAGCSRLEETTVTVETEDAGKSKKRQSANAKNKVKRKKGSLSPCASDAREDGRASSDEPDDDLDSARTIAGEPLARKSPERDGSESEREDEEKTTSKVKLKRKPKTAKPADNGRNGKADKTRTSSPIEQSNGQDTAG